MTQAPLFALFVVLAQANAEVTILVQSKSSCEVIKGAKIEVNQYTPNGEVNLIHDKETDQDGVLRITNLDPEKGDFDISVTAGKYRSTRFKFTKTQYKRFLLLQLTNEIADRGNGGSEATPTSRQVTGYYCPPSQYVTYRIPVVTCRYVTETRTYRDAYGKTHSSTVRKPYQETVYKEVRYPVQFYPRPLYPRPMFPAPFMAPPPPPFGPWYYRRW